jgi:hypothetical protein
MRQRNHSARSAICGALYAISPSALFGRPVWSPLQSLSSDAAAARKDAATELVRSFAFQRVLDDQPCRQAHQPRAAVRRAATARHRSLHPLACPFGCRSSLCRAAPSLQAGRQTEPRMIRQSGEAAPQPSCQQS